MAAIETLEKIHTSTVVEPLDDDKRASVLPAGTRVRIATVEDDTMTLRPVEANDVYQITFEFGAEHTLPGLFLKSLLCDADPAKELESAPPDVAAAVRAGRVMVGMTKQQVIMARGYPPLHRTASLDAPEWLFYDGPGRGQYVTFVEDVVTSVRTGDAP